MIRLTVYVVGAIWSFLKYEFVQFLQSVFYVVWMLRGWDDLTLNEKSVYFSGVEYFLLLVFAYEFSAWVFVKSGFDSLAIFVILVLVCRKITDYIVQEFNSIDH